MKTDVDTCLIELADWYIKNKRGMTNPEFQSILLKHCGSEAEVVKFVKFLDTEPGQVRFKTHLIREKKAWQMAGGYKAEPSTLKEATDNPWGKHWYEAPTERTIGGEVWYFAGRAAELSLPIREEVKQNMKQAGIRVRVLPNNEGDLEFWTQPKVAYEDYKPSAIAEPQKPSLLYEGNETEAYVPLGVAKGISTSVYQVPQWPEVKGIFVGGCVSRGVGSSFRAKAHAHNVRAERYFGWICVRSLKRLGETRETIIVSPSRLMWHEYAHILTPNHPHDDTWRRKMTELHQPITEQYQKRERPTPHGGYSRRYCPQCREWVWVPMIDSSCPRCRSVTVSREF